MRYLSKFFPVILLAAAPAWATSCQTCGAMPGFDPDFRHGSPQSAEFHGFSDLDGDVDDSPFSSFDRPEGRSLGKDHGFRPFWGHHERSIWVEDVYSHDSTVPVTAPVTAPEPGSLGLLATGLVGLGGLLRRRCAR